MRHLRLPAIAALLAAAGCGRPLPLAPAANPDGGRADVVAAGPPALVVALGDEVLFVSEDGGDVRSAYRFAPPDVPSGSLGGGWVTVDARGGHVFASLSANVFDPATDWRQGDRAVLLDAGGTVLWEKAFTAGDLGPGHARAFSGRVGDAGHVVLTVGFSRTFVTRGGGEHLLDGFREAFPPEPGPVVAGVVSGPTGASSFGWWRPGQPANVLGFPMELLLHVATSETRFLFASRDAAGERLVVDARPSGFEVRPWPLEVGEGIAAFGSGAWQGFDLGDEMVRFNALTGEVTRLPWALPAGMRRLGRPSFAADGSLLVVLRDDHRAAVYRSAGAGPDWTRVGKTLGNVESVAVAEVSGSFVIDAVGTGDLFVPTQTWMPAPPGEEPELGGRSHQVVRAADGIAFEPALAIWKVQLSRDGLRALYWRSAQGGYALVVHDLVTGGERQIAFSSYPRAYASVWNR